MRSPGRVCRGLLAVLAAWLCLAPPVGAAPDLRLFVADSPRPGILNGCELYFFARTDGNPWKPVAGPLRLTWPGGGTTLQSREPGEVPAARLGDQCFRLELDGEILIGGALVSAHSARLLDFPVLLVQGGRDDGPVALELRPRLVAPGWPVEEIPPRWLQTLRAHGE